MRDLIVDAVQWFNWFVLFYFLVLNSSFLALIVVAGVDNARSLRRPPDSGHDDIFANPMTPGISVIVPAYNEAACITDSVRALLELRYPQFEVVVVDDGSTDDTFEMLRCEFGLVEVVPDIDEDIAVVGRVQSLHVSESGRSLVVVRKANAGRRGDAVNAGINAARHPLVCCVDADSILESDALLHVARPFVDDPERMIATGGAIRSVNGSTVHRGRLSTIRQPKEWLVRIQIVEYLRSFLLGRTGWSRFGALLIISGAFGVYRRDLLVEVGGFDPTSLGEDADVLVALHRMKRERGEAYRVEFVPQPSCWTEVPATRRVLRSQRIRWSHGLAQVMWKQRRMMFNPRYGKVGMVALPYYAAFELLAPIIELVGVAVVIASFAFGIVNVEFAVLFALVAVLFGSVVSTAALVVEEMSFQKYTRWRDLGVGLVASFLENFGYRQLHAWWRLRGLYDAVRGKSSSWGEMTRTGFASESVRA